MQRLVRYLQAQQLALVCSFFLHLWQDIHLMNHNLTTFPDQVLLRQTLADLDCLSSYLHCQCQNLGLGELARASAQSRLRILWLLSQFPGSQHSQTTLEHQLHQLQAFLQPDLLLHPSQTQ